MEMQMEVHLLLIVLCATSALASANSVEGEYYHPSEDPDRLILWKALFTKLNTLTLAVDKISQNIMDLNKRQEDQGNQIIKLTEAVDFKTKYMEPNERLENLESKISKIIELVDLNTKYLNESHFETKQRLDAVESKISKTMQSADLNTKYLNENCLDSNQRQIKIVKLAETVNSYTNSLNESLLRREELENQITKAQDLTTKLLNDTRPEFKESQAAPEEQIRQLVPPWTTILRRMDGSVRFYKNWTTYQKGFGNPPDGEFFIGLDTLHEITTSAPHELMVVLTDWENETRYANYDLFEIAGETEKYALKKLGIYSGNAGDSLRDNKNMKFSTFDQDNDAGSNLKCAKLFKSAWWFNGCGSSSLNGPYMSHDPQHFSGLSWSSWKGTFYYSHQYAEMKIRPRSL